MRVFFPHVCLLCPSGLLKFYDGRMVTLLARLIPRIGFFQMYGKNIVIDKNKRLVTLICMAESRISINLNWHLNDRLEAEGYTYHQL